ncbi:MAG TPA: hypothetical protein VHO24_16225 [Opitutaceae bacterium]|nr:hypothetical protein [Opitutaceae bacterium]
MNFLLRLRIPLLVSAVSFLAACSTSPLSRIDSNRALYESWPIEVQEAILSKKVIVGMTPEMVQMAVGKPTQVITRSVQSGDDEVWVYRTGGGGGGLLSGVSIGGGVGGVSVGSSGVGGSGGVAEENEIVFRNGVVSRSSFK